MPKKVTTEDFIYRVREVHGDRYGYSKTIYSDARTKVSVTCGLHGDFKLLPSNHVKAVGCPKCAKKYRPSTEEFIEKARMVHGNEYDYDGAKYSVLKGKISIICRKHGMFMQTADNHLQGNGCPSCARHGFDRTKEGYLYLLRSDCGRYAKIGVTNNPGRRHSQLKRATPFVFMQVEIIKGPGVKVAKVEKAILDTTIPVNFESQFDGATEWRLWDEKIRTSLLHQMGARMAHN